MRFTIKLKLAVAFGLVTVLAMVMATLAVVQLTSLNSAITELMNGPVAQSKWANAAENDMNMALLRVRGKGQMVSKATGRARLWNGQACVSLRNSQGCQRIVRGLRSYP